jgi:hypothetical protein
VLNEIVFIIQFVKHGGISALEISVVLLRRFCCAHRGCRVRDEGNAYRVTQDRKGQVRVK